MGTEGACLRKSIPAANLNLSVSVEDVKAHPTHMDHLGLDATDPHEFERTAQKLAEAIAARSGEAALPVTVAVETPVTQRPRSRVGQWHIAGLLG